jgi:hypothetical protein
MHMIASALRHFAVELQRYLLAQKAQLVLRAHLARPGVRA